MHRWQENHVTKIEFLSISLDEAKNKIKIENSGHFNVLIISTHFCKPISFLCNTLNLYSDLTICFVLDKIESIGKKIFIDISKCFL